MKQLEKMLRISSEDFFTNYYLQKHLFVPCEASNNFDEALELKDIEVYLASVPLRHGQIILVNRNNKPWADQFLQLDGDIVVDNTIDIHKLLGLLRNGATAILTDLGKFIPKLKNYCERLGNEMGVRIQANIYITPPQSQGYNVHMDSHDVFVLQLFGKKTWRLYEGLKENPTKTLIRKEKGFNEANHKLAAQIELTKGDLLYVPQGMYHAADTQDGPSIHITLGVLPARTSALLKLLVDNAQDDEFFRSYLPADFQAESKRESFKMKFKEACHQLIAAADIDELLKEVSRQFSYKQPPDMTGVLVDTLQVEQLAIHSEVKRKPNIRYWLEDESWFTTVHFYQEKVQVPKPIEKALELILGNESFKPKQINLDINDQVKLDLVKKFVVGGLLSIVKL
ncbi:MAG: ribosomal protein L16 Arg81 hydroxylase [Roseivirga sp.]|jgi:ribosomal protein L16 Arg81 hydroxylase